MKSTSGNQYHAFGLQGYDYVRQSFIVGSIIFWVKPKPKLVRCPRVNTILSSHPHSDATGAAKSFSPKAAAVSP